TTLFAALVAAKPENVTQMRAGQVIGACMPRHRAKEFLKFLKKIDRTVPKPLRIHAICDNYRTHKSKEVQAWLAKHPRFKLHFTPTSRLGSISSSGCSPRLRANASGAACSRASQTWKPPSRAGSPNGMPSQNPSNGPPRPIRSCRKTPVPEWCWKTRCRYRMNESEH